MTDDVNLQKLENEFYKRLQNEIISKKQDEIRFSVMGDPNISYDQYQWHSALMAILCAFLHSLTTFLISIGKAKFVFHRIVYLTVVGIELKELIKAAHLRPIPKSQLDQRGETSFKRTTKYYDCEEKTQCQ